MWILQYIADGKHSSALKSQNWEYEHKPDSQYLSANRQSLNIALESFNSMGLFYIWATFGVSFLVYEVEVHRYFAVINPRKIAKLCCVSAWKPCIANYEIPPIIAGWHDKRTQAYRRADRIDYMLSPQECCKSVRDKFKARAGEWHSRIPSPPHWLSARSHDIARSSD